MARVTRSKKTDILVAEDNTASSASESFDSNAVAQPNTLTEIEAANAMHDPITAELKGLKAAYKTAIGATQKGRRGRKAKKTQLDSAIAGEGRIDSMNGNPAENAPGINGNGENSNGAMNTKAREPTGRTTRRQAAQAQAEEALLKMNSRNMDKSGTETSAFNVSEFENPREGHGSGIRSIDLSPVRASIKTPSRSPARTLEDVERDFSSEESKTVENTGDDSFVEQIIARSPAKHVSRIEDSVEALDQLEEALEALDQATMAEKMVSPEKTRQKTPSRPFTTPLDTKALMDKGKAERFAKTQNIKQPPKSGYATMRVKPTVPRAPVVKKSASMIFKPAPVNEPQDVQRRPTSTISKRPMSMIVKSKDSEEKEEVVRKPVKRPISLLPPKETVKSTKPVTKSTFELPGEAVARRLKEQREARLAQRDSSEDSFHTARTVSGPKFKSSKPPTTSTFELPGEAVSRRKREAHEARLRAQEEEERKRREFKAKPLRKSNAPNVAPRDTIASRARQSRIGVENIFESSLNTGTNTGTLKRRSIIAPNLPSTNGSNIGAHRPSLSQLASANTSAPRAPGPGLTLIRKPSITTASGISMSGKAMQRTVSATEAQVQRQRAKEIYNRDAKLTEDIERERREREAAAKRAREEAAERGRQASREWAERQLAKKLAEGDKGMGSGYGPGGQLGLKG